jgi:GNAT superfamily N-acetyltransferase
VTVLDGLPADHEAAVHVWHAANVARLLPPALAGWPGSGRSWPSQRNAWSSAPLDADRNVVAMALAEPGRAGHGAGAVIPGYGHVSMVFVHPDLWGRGVGAQLLQGLHKGRREEAGAARRCGPGRPTRALNACT